MVLSGWASALSFVAPVPWRRLLRKGDPQVGPAEVTRQMERDLLRLAETSPHLLSDIGFEKLALGASPQPTRWRLRRLPMVELLETRDGGATTGVGGR